MYELVILRGRVIDGSGSPWFRPDVAVDRGRIAPLGRLSGVSARRAIDAADGLVVPGLVGTHTHSDLTLLVDGRALSSLAQGVTTQVIGNCGVSAAPARDGQLYHGPLDPAMTRDVACDWASLAEYLSRLEAGGVGTNVAERGGVAGRVSHMQPGSPMIGATAGLLATLDEHRARGTDVSCDAIPYTIGSTTLESLLPPWACAGGNGPPPAP